ncbi:MAG: hypothetical protein JNK49_05350 [Planctomycetes bacterium]|nr:hypothetical protein [Planctomycetota bacterium]
MLTAIAIPNSAALLGMQFHQQFPPFNLDPSLNIQEVTASNVQSTVVGPS